MSELSLTENQIKRLQSYVSLTQFHTTMESLNGDEFTYFAAKVKAFCDDFTSLENAQNTDSELAIAHYFKGNSDWWISEVEGTTAFGFCVLNGDVSNAELGYISIPELTGCGVELDFHYAPELLPAIIERVKGQAKLLNLKCA